MSLGKYAWPTMRREGRISRQTAIQALGRSSRSSPIQLLHGYHVIAAMAGNKQQESIMIANLLASITDFTAIASE